MKSKLRKISELTLLFFCFLLAYTCVLYVLVFFIDMLHYINFSLYSHTYSLPYVQNLLFNLFVKNRSVVHVFTCILSVITFFLYVVVQYRCPRFRLHFIIIMLFGYITSVFIILLLFMAPIVGTKSFCILEQQ